MRALAPLTDDHEVVITHGNGPQVGVLAMETASDVRLSQPYPFDALGAMTQGLIGYWILQAIGNERPYRQFAAVLNQTLVDADDPGTLTPDGAEILDLRWFSRDDLVAGLGEIVLPGRTSIARAIIEDWFGGEIDQ